MHENQKLLAEITGRNARRKKKSKSVYSVCAVPHTRTHTHSFHLLFIYLFHFFFATENVLISQILFDVVRRRGHKLWLTSEHQHLVVNSFN